MEEIKVYDQNDQQITILVQWDLDIYIYFKEEKITKAHNVHFFNSESDIAYVTESTYSDDTMCTKIPNRLLFSALPITGYIYTTEDNETYRNTYVFTIPVRERAIPSNFSYIEADGDDYINTEKVLAECEAYATSAAASASEAQDWTNLSKSWAVGDTGVRDGEDTDNSKYYAAQSAASAEESLDSSKLSESWAVGGTDTRDGEDTDNSKYYAEQSAMSAEESEISATQSATSAQESATSADKSESYAVGGTGTREDEDTDNAKYYYQHTELLIESLSGALRPMGTVAFEDLPQLDEADAGDMYNISNEFTTTDDFEEGSGHVIPLGSNVYKTMHDKWDVLAGSPVTGVKGDAEDAYRKGNVNITLDDMGIENVLGGDITEEDIDNIFE